MKRAVDDNFDQVSPYGKRTNFDEFRQEININMIVVSDELQNNPRFKNDEEWGWFLENYPSLGYEQMDIPNSDMKLIVKEDLI